MYKIPVILVSRIFFSSLMLVILIVFVIEILQILSEAVAIVIQMMVVAQALTI